MSTPENLPQVFEDDSIDLIALLKQIYQGRKLIILSVLIAAILGLLVAFNTPSVYTAGLTFIPQTANQSRSSSGLSGLASLAGISLGATNSGSDIPPSLYPRIISSKPFKMDLMKEEIEVNGKGCSIEDFLNEKEEISTLERIKNFIFNQLNHISNSDSDVLSKTRTSSITEDDRELYDAIDEKLNLFLNEKEGFVTLEFSDRNKYAAAQVAEIANKLLQQKIIEFKNQSAREVLDFVFIQYQNHKTSYEGLQDSIAIFRDRNLNITSSLYQNRLDRLERELNLASSILEQLASQVEQAKLQVNKNTPVFTILDPVTVPMVRSSPNRRFIVFIYSFLGLFMSIGYILLKEPLKRITAFITS